MNTVPGNIISEITSSDDSLVITCLRRPTGPLSPSLSRGKNQGESSNRWSPWIRNLHEFRGLASDLVTVEGTRTAGRAAALLLLSQIKISRSRICPLDWSTTCLYHHCGIWNNRNLLAWLSKDSEVFEHEQLKDRGLRWNSTIDEWLIIEAPQGTLHHVWSSLLWKNDVVERRQHH